MGMLHSAWPAWRPLCSLQHPQLLLLLPLHAIHEHHTMPDPCCGGAVAVQGFL
jgi:hypothetical protein